jgi:tetratricopeptide (TPR) repeat protein
VRINELVIFIVIGVLSLVVGIWIPRDRGALAVALVTVTIGVVIVFPLWHAVARRRSQVGAAGLARAAQPLASRDYLVPRELPPGPADFVGRHDELQQLEAAINRPRDAGPFIAVIHGDPGIGKSALAVTFARQMAPSFPAGQLFVQMHGATDLPGKAEDLIEYFVVALKAPDDPVPTEGGELRDKYRELTMGCSVLFVLDDIPVNLDIDALCLASPTCAFIVTCREEPEWPAASCEWIALGELAESEALSMLSASIGEDRVSKEEKPSRDLASLCGRQPQALRAAGTAVANRPDWDIRLILEQTHAALKRKARQRSGTFDTAYALLTADEQRALQVLGAIDRPQIRPWMLAAALGTSEAGGHRLASRLADAGLIERYNPGSGTPSYRVEDPVLRYASLQLADEEFADTVRSMVGVAERDQGDESLASLDELLKIKDGGTSFTAAIGKVRSVLSSAQERRSKAGEAEACAALAELYADLGDMIGAEELARRAIGISSDMADLGHARARAGRCLVRIERRHHRLDSAIEHANRALASAESVNDQPERIRILQEKAVVLAMNELPVEAAAMSEAALDACGSPDVDGASLRPGVRWSRGTVLLHARRYREAAVVLAAGKREAEEQGQPRMCAWIDLVSAHVAFETCDYDAGERYATAAMDVFTGLRHRYGTAHCRYQLGQISLARGRLEADRSLREALETFHNCADSWIEGEVSLVLAEAYRRQGQVRAAIGLQLKARRSYHRMNGQAQARQATRELIRTLLTGPPARLRMLWSANSRPDGA